MMQESLFERLGGSPAITIVISRLYGKLLNDPLLIPMFQGIDVEKLRRSQYAFVTMATGGGSHYNGKSLALAHRHLVKERGLNDTHFDAVANHLADVLHEVDVPQNLINELLAIVETTRNDILGHGDPL